MQRRIDNGGKPSTRGTGSKVSGVAGLGGPSDAKGFETHVGVQTTGRGSDSEAAAQELKQLKVLGLIMPSI